MKFVSWATERDLRKAKHREDATWFTSGDNWHWQLIVQYKGKGKEPWADWIQLDKSQVLAKQRERLLINWRRSPRKNDWDEHEPTINTLVNQKCKQKHRRTSAASLMSRWSWKLLNSWGEMNVWQYRIVLYLNAHHVDWFNVKGMVHRVTDGKWNIVWQTRTQIKFNCKVESISVNLKMLQFANQFEYLMKVIWWISLTARTYGKWNVV